MEGKVPRQQMRYEKLVLKNFFLIVRWNYKRIGDNLPDSTSNACNKTSGLSRKQFDTLLASAILIFENFYADWLCSLKIMKPYLEEILKYMADKVQIIRINADDIQALCKEFQIDALPVLQFYQNLMSNNVFF